MLSLGAEEPPLFFPNLNPDSSLANYFKASSLLQKIRNCEKDFAVTYPAYPKQLK